MNIRSIAVIGGATITLMGNVIAKKYELAKRLPIYTANARNDARMRVKLPNSLKAKKAVLFDELAKDAMEYSNAHKRSHRGDIPNLSNLLPVFDKIKVEEITFQMISAYFSTRTDLKPASINR